MPRNLLSEVWLDTKLKVVIFRIPYAFWCNLSVMYYLLIQKEVCDITNQNFLQSIMSIDEIYWSFAIIFLRNFFNQGT